MKTILFVLTMILSSTAFSKSLVVCNLIDYAAGGRLVSSVTTSTDDEWNQVNDLTVGSVGEVTATLSFVQILSESSAKIVMKLGNTVSSSTVLLDSVSTLQVGLVQLECGVK